ncbi:hypothetical protein EXIGLDRAFT_759315 [Exidia glandulosa HHB12029]|uniref:Uncharacterized protein n=1 Tax=Exidia glandulosa HHB12029 TaxID=1314781 RepID=A0A165Q2R1_EXIGL|nr:hypothetical protein EXIGLDRAFT_759315 [Exidia glandulosa HHB12029]
MSSSSSNVQLALSMLEAVTARSWTHIEKVLATTIEWSVLPDSLQRPPMVGIDTVLEGLKSLTGLVQNGSVKVQPIEIIEGAGFVVIHVRLSFPATSTVKLTNYTKAKTVDTVTLDDPVSSTYEIMFCTFYLGEENGEKKIVRVKDFVDSAFMQSLAAHLAQNTV